MVTMSGRHQAIWLRMAKTYTHTCQATRKIESTTNDQQSAYAATPWGRYYGYVPMTTITQDNLSHYFVTDQMKKGHLKVAFCATQDMLADLLTKPLQGAPFIYL